MAVDRVVSLRLESSPEVPALSDRKKKHRKKSTEKARQLKEGAGRLKVIIGVLVLLVVAATVAAGLSGADRLSRGTLPAGSSCTATSECAKGHICYSGDGPFSCRKTCRSTDDCQDGETCRTVIQNARRKLKTAHVCMPDAKAR